MIQKAFLLPVHNDDKAFLKSYLNFYTHAISQDNWFVHAIFRFQSLLATKLQKYENITQSLFIFCKARWARREKKMKIKSRN